MIRTLLAIFAMLLWTGTARAQPVDDPNYTTQNLIIVNDAGEVLLQRNFMGWSTPGARYDKRLTIHEGLADLARTYGVEIGDVRLAGLFSYRYGYTPAISTRSHYRARLTGGSARAPAGFDDLRWFAPDAAIAAIASDSQKSPPALVELMRQMLSRPETIWTGAFYIWQDGETYRSKILEPFAPLGQAR
ncbi:hypothetical protein DMC47_17520 [Nostoc sp. 3335mG]|nr:hypothetical protein DMC47_17520 [Nostoc sp. 3335mG]